MNSQAAVFFLLSGIVEKRNAVLTEKKKICSIENTGCNLMFVGPCIVVITGG